ncbi:hypothetical protein B8W90_13620, partial [Staphylococcus hominis]
AGQADGDRHRGGIADGRPRCRQAHLIGESVRAGEAGRGRIGDGAVAIDHGDAVGGRNRDRDRRVGRQGVIGADI